jgi:hypothetical protein
MNELKRIVCDNWKDYDINKFKFYDFNGEILEISSEFSTVRKVLEEYIVIEFVEK